MHGERQLWNGKFNVINFKKIKLKVLKNVYNIFYQLISLTTKRKKRIVIASNRSSFLRGNLLAIHEELQSNSEFEVVLYLFHFERSIKGRIVYFFKSFMVIYYLATSSVFIIDDYLFPLYCIKKRKENIVIQVWHAVGTLKKFGLSIPQNQKDIVVPHSNYDWVIVNSSEDIESYIEAFGVKREQVLPLGVPKLKKIQQKIKAVEKKSILYAPTYRREKDPFIVDQINEFIASVEKELPEWEIIVSLHPYVKNRYQLNYGEKVKIISPPQTVEDYYSSADVFVTDYSATLLEYSYFEQPILIYAPDLKKYKKEPGFYVDFEKYLNIPVFKKVDDIVYYMKNDDRLYDVEPVKTLKSKIFKKNTKASSVQKIREFCEKLINQ